MPGAFAPPTRPANAGELSVTAVKARTASGAWEDVLGGEDGACVVLLRHVTSAPDGTTFRTVSFALAVNGQQDLAAIRPASTLYTVAFRGSPGRAPLSIRGYFAGVRMVVGD